MIDQAALSIEADDDNLPDDAGGGLTIDTSAMPDFEMSQEELAARLWADLKQDLAGRSAKAEADMIRLARRNGTEVRGFIDGIGQNVAGIPREVYAYWIARLGHNAWDDGDLLKYLAKKNPGLLRQSKGKPMVCVAWGGRKAAAAAA